MSGGEVAAYSEVCVVIAAYNSERTIARAIASALSQPEVSEIVIVDDASSDDTVSIARAISNERQRVRIIAQAENAGPAAARNRAIAESKAPWIAILDADDYFLPGRFALLKDIENWDAIADNIAFVPENSGELPSIAPPVDNRVLPIDLELFIEGNISRPNKPRGEIGFMKPVMRRAFLDRHELRYDESMRLGEDYALYLRMLLADAQFGLTRTCGYVATERGASLSGRHRTADLAALLQSDRALLASKALSVDDRAAISRHAKHIAARYHHRRILDIRRESGRFSAALAAAASPAKLPALIAAVARDKFGRPPPPLTQVRYLFD